MVGFVKHDKKSYHNNLLNKHSLLFYAISVVFKDGGMAVGHHGGIG